MLIIHNFEIENKDDKEFIYQKIDGIPFSSYDFYTKEQQLKVYLEKYKNSYSHLIDANDEFLLIINEYLGDPGDGNTLLVLEEIDRLSVLEFMKYVNIEETDEKNNKMLIKIDISKLVDDLHLKAWSH